MRERYLAHKSEDGREQSLLEHLEETGRLAGGFAAAFEAEELGMLMGLAHDIGKYTEGFQKRLEGGPRVDHSTAGAYECARLGMPYAAFGIAGHHGGLPEQGGRGDAADSGTLIGRLGKAESGGIEDYSAFRREIRLQRAALPGFCNQDPLTDFFFVRMLFSCLVDADYLDTERFMSGGRADSLGHGEKEKPDEAERRRINGLDEKLREYTAKWFPPQNRLNELRCEILKSCMEKGESEEPGLFTLTVPTGGGKTVSSLAFALRHAAAYGKRRVIYVIPYTSIIEQTAAVFDGILGKENVLEHHSGVQYEIGEDMEKEDMRKAGAVENWDMPVIVTTAVQFFESLYSNRPSKCRKLHNIADSVVIFDEVQMLPIPYLWPCVHAISQLVMHYGVSAVLCTATQPALDGIFRRFYTGREPVELCPPGIRNDGIFRRVRFEKCGKISWEALGVMLNREKQVLCIVNSRKNASLLYQQLEKEGAFHLSTLMCPAHRRSVLGAIRKRLQEGKACRVVATSLIEAGVDVDFPTVFREMAGLDSILQAAGRCNREGKRKAEESVVTVFQAETPPPPLFAMPVGAARNVLESGVEIDDESAIRSYFEELLDLKGEKEQDKKNILNEMKVGNFPETAEAFRMIENNTRTVYIPADRNQENLSRLRQGERSKEIFRQLGEYGVSVYSQHFQALYGAGDLELLDEETAILVNDRLYSEETGLSLEADYGKGYFV